MTDSEATTAVAIDTWANSVADTLEALAGQGVEPENQCSYVDGWFDAFHLAAHTVRTEARS